MNYLGINAFSHDSSAALVTSDGKVVAAVEEERFTRVKKEPGFPVNAIRYCLAHAGLEASDLDGVAIGWHPWFLLRDRIFRENLCERLDLSSLFRDLKKASLCWRFPSLIEGAVGKLSRHVRIRYYRHHLAHAASAFYGSPFDSAAFLTIDGRGERESVTWGVGEATKLRTLGTMSHPHSYGKLYSGMAKFCGFWGSDAEGTAMAFAGLGEALYREQIELIMGGSELRESPELASMNTGWLDPSSGHALPTKALSRLLGCEPREPHSSSWKPYADFSASTQLVLEEAILRLARRIHDDTGKDAVVLAGGVALNSVANGRLIKEGPFSKVFIQPAAHDGGLAIGCGLLLAHEHLEEKLPCDSNAPFYGPSYPDRELKQVLESYVSKGAITVSHLPNAGAEAAKAIAKGQIVAWFQGRLEFGPRALGNRSLLADVRDAQTVQRLNSIKGRESFRPFAIAILEEERSNWLVHGFLSPHMLVVDRIKQDRVSWVPSASHVDGTVRTQTLARQQNPAFYDLIKHFFAETGVPMVINTSLNVRGEPLCCKPQDAIRTLLESDIDVLVMGDFWVTRTACSLSALTAQTQNENNLIYG